MTKSLRFFPFWLALASAAFGNATIGLPSGLPAVPTGAAGGSLAGTYPNPTLNQSVAQTWTVPQFINIASQAQTQNAGFTLENLTAATVGVQQFSPLLAFRGSGWGTTAPGAQSVVFGWQVQPVQGTTAPTANYVLLSQLNGGSLITAFSSSLTGALTLGSSSSIASAPATDLTLSAPSNQNVNINLAGSGQVLINAGTNGTGFRQIRNSANTEFFNVANSNGGILIGVQSSGASSVVSQNGDSTLQLQAQTYSQTSGSFIAVQVIPTYNQASGTAANTDLLIKRVETALGSGSQYIIDAFAGTTGNTEVFNVGNAGDVLAKSITGLPSTKLTLNGGSGASPSVQIGSYQFYTNDFTGSALTTGQPDMHLSGVSAGTPGYGFYNDNGLGMYRGASGELDFAASSSKIASINSTGLSVQLSTMTHAVAVGAGSTNTYGAISFNGSFTATGILGITAGAADANMYLNVPTGGSYSFLTNNSSAVTITNGSVVVPSTTDQSGANTGALQVSGGASIAKSLLVGTSIQSGAPSGDTAAAWLLGSVHAVSPTSPNRTVAISVGGTVFYVAAKTTDD